MFKQTIGQHLKLLFALSLFAVTGAVLLVTGEASSDAVTVPQGEVTIEPLGHFGGLLFSIAVPPTGEDYVYLGEGSGLTVLDTSNPSQPRQVGGLPMNGSDVKDVDILESTAYVLKDGRLHVVDLSDPTSLTLMGETDVPGTGRAVAAAGSYAYVAADVGGTDGWVYTVDVSDATDPDPVGSYDTVGLASDVHAAGDAAYVADSVAGLLILDVTNPISPSLLSSYPTPGSVHGVQVVSTTAYLLTLDEPTLDYWLRIVDVSDPTDPTPLGAYDAPDAVNDVRVFDGMAYLASGSDGLHIVDLSDPANPVPLSTSSTEWWADKVAVSDTHAYLIGNALQIFDVSDPADPDVLGDYERPNFVLDVVVDYPYYYLAGWDKLWVVDMTDPVAPAVLGSSDLSTSNLWLRRLSLSAHPQTGDPLIYAANQGAGVEILDVVDPSNPTLLGGYPAPVDNEVNDVFAVGPYAYVVTDDDGNGRLRILDVSNPANPDEIEVYDTPGDAQRVFVADDVAYVADGKEGLRLIDVSDPESPAELDHIDPPVGGSTDVVWVDGDQALVGSNTESGWWLESFDISDPANPTPLANQQGTGHLNDIEADQDYAYLALTSGDGSVRATGNRLRPGHPAQTTTTGVVACRRSDLTTAGGYTTDGAYSVHRYSVSAAGFTITYVIIDKGSLGTETIEIETPGQPTQTPTPETPTATPTVTPTPTPSASWSKAGPDVTAPGHVLPYVVTLRWDSPDGSPAPSTMTDVLPEYIQHVPGSASANLGTVDTSDPSRITWSGTIPDWGAAIIHFSLFIPCDGLMRTRIEEWPDAIRNRATGHVGPFPYAVAKSTELLKPDITISALEVNQSIQNLNNDMRLIKEKETYVRLYIQTEYPNGFDGCAVPDVTARLTGGPGPDLGPINASITAEVLAGQLRPTQDERDKLEKSLYFRLPRPWRSSNYKLTAEVNPDGERPDEDTKNNTEEHDVSFVDTDRLYLYLVPIRYTYEQATFLQPDRYAFTQALKFLRIYPTPDENRKLRWVTPYVVKHPLHIAATHSGLLWYLWEMNSFRSANRNSENIYYMGVLDDLVNTGPTNGLGYVNQYASWVKMSTNRQLTGERAAHELGHNLGRWHVDCPPGRVPLTRPYPYPKCQLSHGGRTDYYGFDTDRPNVNVRNPRTNADVMSYSHWQSIPQWISDFTYNAAYERLKVPTRQMNATSDEPAGRLLVSGLISPTLSTATLRPIYRLDESSFQNGLDDGPYTLELQDSQGKTVVTDTFDVVVIESTGDLTIPGERVLTETLPFLHALPYHPEATRLLLKHDDTVLDTRVASASPPTVTLTAPNGGESITGTTAVTWTGDDQDGDPLEYVLQHSADGGDSWQPVAIRLTDTSYTVDTADLPGGDECLFRVAASDGFHTAYDRSDHPFSMPRKAPTVFIMDPEEGQTYAVDEWVLLTALAYDQDNDDLAEENLAWTSDVDGPLGTGSEVALESLSPAWHTITLTGADGEGLTSSHSVHVCVGCTQVYLPLVLRGNVP
jgi:hypothetical protein